MAEMVAGSSSRDLKSEDSNLIVALRVRPMTEDEILEGARPIAHCVDDNLVILMDPMDDNEDVLRQNRSREKQFMFDIAFDAKSTQEDVYRRTCKLLIPSVVNGYNGTVFAYGATGAGKTYTMLGRDDNPGIMALALTELFYEMERNGEELSYKVSMSYLEIYNEMIRDLLSPGSGFLDLREDAKGVQVAGLSEHSAKNTAEVMAILKEGNKQRTQEPTAANKTSSRSHAVLIISVRQRNRVDGIHQQLRIGKLFLIDLAGSERAANTQNRGKRMVEGAHINRSLLALGNCINALSDKNSSKYINYRDSKLTRLLKDALGGNCKTVMIAHVSPASFFFEESRNTLTYADRAKNIRTKVRQNVLDMTLHISQYSNIIAELREEIRRLKQKIDQQGQAQKNAATLHAIQTEVIRRDDDPEFSRLKNELQNVLTSQTELRQNLIDLNKSEAEMNVESTRLQLELNRLERDKQLKSNRLNVVTSKDGGTFDAGKVKKELKSLTKEMQVSERQKKDIERKLDDLRNKTLKLQEELRRLSNSPDQKEILALLSRIHTLESENTQLQSSLLLRMFDLRRRDLLISLQDHERLVGSELIQQQKALITDGQLTVPNQLIDMQNVYQREVQDLESQRGSLLLPSLTDKKDSSFAAIPEKSWASGDDGHQLPRLFVPVQSNKRMKTFVNAAKQDSHSLDSHRSATSTPATFRRHSPTVEDLILDSEDRMAMNNATRSIARLAAKRRGGRTVASKPRHSDPDRHLYRRDQYGVFHLTESRLEQHNQRYNNGAWSNPTSDKHSTSTTETGPRLHRTTQGGRRTTKAAPEPTTYYDRFSKDDSQQILYQKTNRPKENLRKEATTNRMVAKLNGARYGAGDSEYLASYPTAEKDSVLKRLKTLKEPGQPDRVSKAPSTIPASYRKGDISVTGHSIQQ